MMDRIITFGEVMGRIEAEHFMRFRQVLPGQVRITFAGAEANVAASLSFLGRDASFVTSLPKNDIAESCISYLRGTGMGTEEIRQIDEGRLGLYFLEAGANQRPSNVIYDRAGSSVAIADPASYDWDEIFSGASWFHISGITPAISQETAAASLESVKKAKEHGVTVSCDLNYRKKLWNWDEQLKKKDLAKKVMSEMMDYIDVVIGNEEDASDVLGIEPEGVDVNAGSLNSEAYINVARQILTSWPNVKKIAFTLRESISASHNNWGAMLYDVASGTADFAPSVDGVYTPYQMKNIVDRVGGGDSFSAGLIYALTDEELSRNTEAVAFAAAASCLCHSIHGDINYSTKEEVLRLMHGNGSGRVVR